MNLDEFLINRLSSMYLLGMARTDLYNAKVFLRHNMKKSCIYSINALIDDINRLERNINSYKYNLQSVVF